MSVFVGSGVEKVFFRVALPAMVDEMGGYNVWSFVSEK